MDLSQYILDHVEHYNGCWLWTGRVCNHLTPVIMIGENMRSARKLSYELLGENLEYKGRLRLKCGNRECVNPAHLVPTHAFDKDLGYCRKGLHKMVGRNVMLNNGRASCRACMNAWRRRKYSLKKEKVP